jgi:hypothetical protein
MPFCPIADCTYVRCHQQDVYGSFVYGSLRTTFASFGGGDVYGLHFIGS